jgi:hypothetical protein
MTAGMGVAVTTTGSTITAATTAAAVADGGAGATMTDAPGRRARSNRPAVVAYGGSAVAFAGVLAALGWQLASGADPAIGEGEPAAAPADRVVVRRIVRRVIVGRDTPAARTAAPQAPAAPAPAPPPTTRAS